MEVVKKTTEPRIIRAKVTKVIVSMHAVIFEGEDVISEVTPEPVTFFSGALVDLPMLVRHTEESLIKPELILQIKAKTAEATKLR